MRYGVLLAFGGLACLVMGGVACAQQPVQPKVDISQFAGELAKYSGDKQQIQFALWLPREFMVEAALATDPTKTREEVEKDTAVLQPYVTMILQCKVLGADGRFTQGEQGIRARARLKLDNGDEVLPIETVPADVAAVVQIIRDEMAAALGERGEDMHIIVFPSVNKDKPVIEIAKRDRLTLALTADDRFQATTFIWHSPFEALAPNIDCPKCHESLSPQWSFCPWCGEKMAE